MNEESLDKMSRMRLLGMQQAFKACIDETQPVSFTNDELVHHLVCSEWDDRHYRTQQRSIKNANFRYPATTILVGAIPISSDSSVYVIRLLLFMAAIIFCWFKEI